MSNKIVKPLTLAIGAAFLGSVGLTQLAQASTAFQLDPLNSGYMVGDTKAHEGKCGEGKCGVSKMDANKDGKVSKDEALTAGFSADEIAKMDTNKDGMLSQAEIDAAKKAKGKEGSCGGDKKGKEGSCGGDKKDKEGSCGGHL